MTDHDRLDLIAEAVRYCQRVAVLGMPVCCYSKAIREPVHFLWERRAGSKLRAASYRSLSARGLTFGSGNLVYDHAIPFVLLQRELLALADVTTVAVHRTLERYGTIVLITRDDDAKLTAAGVAHSMPRDWDRVDALARYRLAGVQLELNL